MSTITPSKKRSPWAGGMADQLTQAQYTAIKKMTPARVNERIAAGLPPYYRHAVSTKPGPRDNGIPGTAYAKCVVLRTDRDHKRLEVIAPDGSLQWVDWLK